MGCNSPSQDPAKYRPQRPHRGQFIYLRGHHAVGTYRHHHPRTRLYRPQPTDSDRGSNVWSRRFSGSFSLMMVVAVGAVGVLRTFLKVP
jgi:hypothetical protein